MINKCFPAVESASEGVGWGGGDRKDIITQPHWILLHSSALTVSVIVDGL